VSRLVSNQGFAVHTLLQVIVFFPTARAAQFHAALARASGVEAYDLHSRLSQKQRDTAAAAFGRSPTAVMFASDVIARGLDFPDVSLVVQVRFHQNFQKLLFY
jgi:ATP-dependent RNA helicase MSS116